MNKGEIIGGRRIALALLGTTALFGGFVIAPVSAQAPAAEQASTSGSLEAAADQEGENIVITGSRIRRSDTETSAPVSVFDAQSLTDRGIFSAADALNQSTSIDPNFNQATGTGTSAGNGQQFPQLFGLGAGRTLTLLNGRRMVTSSSGMGDAQVDANIIPTGLMKRIEIVQAGGAAVYGSDAIAGVVNYILRDDFEGLELDAQSGLTTRGDFATKSARLTAGKNFGGGRGNIAINVEWSKTPTLAMADRWVSNLSRMTRSNPADTGPSDGIPSSREVFDVRMWEFNANGVLFNAAAPVKSLMTSLNGQQLQFSPDGKTIVPYNVGDNYSVPFGAGGDGFRYADLAGLRTGVERVTGNVLAHYELTDSIKLSTELLYARTRGDELPQGQSRTILSAAATGYGPIGFTRNNPYLTPEVIATLSAARPAFATGGTLYLSKYFYDLVTDNRVITTTETYRGLLALDGDFSIGDRNFYWSVSGSYARVDGSRDGYGVDNSKYNNAINAVRNSAGTIVCGINADAITTNDDAACAPINPFGNYNVSQAARDYISIRTGNNFRNEQIDLLATLGGDLFTLPGGTVSFSTAYEHRDESAAFSPSYAEANGLVAAGDKTLATSGRYDTDELSAELLVPLVGRDFRLPLVQKLELTGAYRYVDNSVAGTENVWDIGLRWTVTDGVVLRGSRSRNFRAPTLSQLFAPTSVALSQSGPDPCDADRANLGSNPAVRRANCLALFRANPAYGQTSTLPANATAEQRLAAFQDPAENFPLARITSGGNNALENEVSDTWSYGVVLQPRFIPGLTITADRVEVKLKDGLTAFATTDFMAACFDNPDQPAVFCNAFTRNATDVLNPDGSVLAVAGSVSSGRTTTVNASLMRFEGEVYNINYIVPLRSIFGGNPGTLELGVEATHTTRLESQNLGVTTRTDGTASQPEWSGRFDARYGYGPLRVTYQAFYLSKSKANFDATIETTPFPYLKANIQHNISAQYDFGQFILRAGVNNFTDQMPSYPSLSFGDIIGRRFYVGGRVRF